MSGHRGCRIYKKRMHIIDPYFKLEETATIVFKNIRIDTRRLKFSACNLSFKITAEIGNGYECVGHNYSIGYFS